MRIIQISKLEQIIQKQRQDIVYQGAMGFCPESDRIVKLLDDILLLAEMDSEQVEPGQTNYCVGRCRSRGEKTVARALIELGYTPYHNVQKQDCCGASRPLPFDFGIIVNGRELLIEYDGEQHDQPVDFFGGASKLEKIEQYDRIKDRYCQENGIPLLRIRQKTGIKPLLRNFIEQAGAGPSPEHESPGTAICS